MFRTDINYLIGDTAIPQFNTNNNHRKEKFYYIGIYI